MPASTSNYSSEQLYAELQADHEFFQSHMPPREDRIHQGTMFVLLRVLTLRPGPGQAPSAGHRFELDRMRAHTVRASTWRCRRRGFSTNGARRRGERQADFIENRLLPSFGQSPPPFTEAEEQRRAEGLVRALLDHAPREAEDAENFDFASGGWLSRPRPDPAHRLGPFVDYTACREAFRRCMAAGEDCPICLEKMHDPRITVCAHVFCGSCVKRVVAEQGRCPMCREPLPNGKHLLKPPAGATGASNNSCSGGGSTQS